MIDNVRQTMDRMAAIRATITGQATAPPPASNESMESLLAKAMSRAALGSNTLGRTLAPAAGPIRSGAPPGFEPYRNGQLPLALLTPISGTNELMWAPAAQAFERMRFDAAGAGVDLGVTDAYRPVDQQYKLAEELGLYSQGGAAAVPGTSEHGWGRALDLDLDDKALGWLRTNGWKYGYVETVPREPWHWEFHPAG